LPTSPLAPSTVPPSGHCWFPIVDPHRHREPFLVSPSSLQPPKRLQEPTDVL
jgi:hypothetical protein